MSSESAARQLEFTSLSQVKDEVNNLLKTGYAKTGQWDLSQICGHLNSWMTFPIDGYPKAIFPINVMLWMGKVTVGKRLLHKTLTEKRMKPGSPTMPASVFEPDHQDDEKAAMHFCSTIDRFESFNGTIHTSPLFGAMDYDKARQLQLVHCAHHLNFLRPRTSSSA